MLAGMSGLDMIIGAANSTGLRSAEKEEPEARPREISALDHLVINVTNVEASAAWYVEVLGMKRLEYGTDRDRPRTALLFGSVLIDTLNPVPSSLTSIWNKSTTPGTTLPSASSFR
ncbi:VOC family protein [Rhizobium dioscoreae]|uniref:VOC family protein n=2 Tax=Rhizobium/Agrobacterium group TaxID=227290 RepID=UPI003327774E